MWHMKSFIHVYLVCLLFVSGCASAPKQVYQCYSGMELPESSLAVIEMGYANYLVVDGMYYIESSKYSSAKLLPGDHKLKWSMTFYISAAVDPRMRVESTVTEKVDLLEGHTYRIFSDRTYGHGYRTYTWIEDLKTRKVTAGTKIP
jgi:hypothetical protein